jgi:hypothetical protein
MGNKHGGENGDRTNIIPNPMTPKKPRSNNIFASITSNEIAKSKSTSKEGLYAEEKLFENFESKKTIH